MPVLDVARAAGLSQFVDVVTGEQISDLPRKEFVTPTVVESDTDFILRRGVSQTLEIFRCQERLEKGFLKQRKLN